MSPTLVAAVLLGVVEIFGGANAQTGVPCHAHIFQFTPRHNLNISAYMGNWYMQEYASSFIGNTPAPDYTCAVRSLSLPNETDITNIVAVDTLVNSTTGRVIEEPSTFTINNTRSPFTSMWYHTIENVAYDVIILSADLDFAEWTVVYSCGYTGPNNDFRWETATAMTRSRTITPELRKILKALMVGQGFRIGDHHQIDQSNCQD